MDLTGRAQGYRDLAIRCPGCAEPMTVRPGRDGDLDLCTACGGVWLDWFDGEVRTVANELAATQAASSPVASADPSALRNEERATGACPRCATQLVIERHAGTGAELRRCEHCAGVFLSAISKSLLAVLPPEPDRVEGGAGAKGARGVGWLAPVRRVLRRLFRSHRST